MTLRVHWNLRRGGWSVLHRTPAGWRVRECADRLILRDAKPSVSEAGRRRAMDSGVRNVHAFIEGTEAPLRGQWGPDGFPFPDESAGVRLRWDLVAGEFVGPDGSGHPGPFAWAYFDGKALRAIDKT